MQGYVLKVIKTKSEDLILKILCEDKLLTLYRFYGARHSTLHLGYKIDFEIQAQGVFMPRLRNVLHLGNDWESDFERVYVWQRYISLLHTHLSDVYEIERFYYDMLENARHKIGRQNPVRVAVEMYLELLNYEGRTQRQEYNNTCFICENILEDKVAISRGFLFAHTKCVHGSEFDKNIIQDMLHTKSTINIDDTMIYKLWDIVNLGL